MSEYLVLSCSRIFRIYTTVLNSSAFLTSSKLVISISHGTQMNVIYVLLVHFTIMTSFPSLAMFTPTFDYDRNQYFKSFLTTSTFFGPNVPRNMRQCTLRLGYAAWPPYTLDMRNRNTSGFEGELIYLIVEKFNVQFTMERYQYIDSNMLRVITIQNASYKPVISRQVKLHVSCVKTLPHALRCSEKYVSFIVQSRIRGTISSSAERIQMLLGTLSSMCLLGIS